MPTSGRGVHENFYPRPPRGGRPQDGAASHSRPYFYPRPPRGGRRRRGSNAPVCYVISTHALREEGDPRRTARPPPRRYFYPRPPRGGRRGVFLRPRNYSRFLPTPSARRATPHDEGLCNFHPFLPTPSARRATYHMMRGFAISTHFYPRPPRGGRPGGFQQVQPQGPISTHALREEGDGLFQRVYRCLCDFYPRPPRGGRLCTPVRRGGRRAISTHALREEGDPGRRGPYTGPVHFYPRPPRGGRHTYFML